MTLDKILLIKTFPHVDNVPSKQRVTIGELSIILNSLVESEDITEAEVETLRTTGKVVVSWDTEDAEFGIIKDWCIIEIKDEHEA